MANDEMTEQWNGPSSEPWLRFPDRYDAMLGDLGRLVLQAADPRPGEAVLDVGCGAGQLTLEAAERVGPAGRVVGVDLSAPLLDLARRRASEAAVESVTFLEADAQVHALLPDAFDVVLSRFGVMFFDDPVAAFENLRRATAPAGRLAFVAWQESARNEWMELPNAVAARHLDMPVPPLPDAPGPVAFGHRERVQTVLTDSGWVDVRVEDVQTTLLVGGPGTVDDAVTFYDTSRFGRTVLDPAGPEQRAAVLAELRAELSARMGTEGLRLGAAVWIVTAQA